MEENHFVRGCALGEQEFKGKHYSLNKGMIFPSISLVSHEAFLPQCGWSLGQVTH